MAYWYSGIYPLWTLFLKFWNILDKTLGQNELHSYEHLDILLSDDQFKHQAIFQSTQCTYYCKSVSLFTRLGTLKCCLFSHQRSVWNFFHFSAKKNLWTFHKVVILFLSFLLRSTENSICNATWDTSIYTCGRYIICETSSRKLSGLIGKIKLSIRGMNHIWQILTDRLEDVIVIVRELHFSFKCLPSHITIIAVSSYHSFNLYIYLLIKICCTILQI